MRKIIPFLFFFEHYFENIILKVQVVRNFTIFKICERLFSDRKGKNSLFTNEEKLELAELVSKRKEEYDAEVARNVGKFKYDSKRKKHVPIKPTCGFLAKAVHEFYSGLDVKNDDPRFNRALKLAS